MAGIRKKRRSSKKSESTLIVVLIFFALCGLALKFIFDHKEFFLYSIGAIAIIWLIWFFASSKTSEPNEAKEPAPRKPPAQKPKPVIPVEKRTSPAPVKSQPENSTPALVKTMTETPAEIAADNLVPEVDMKEIHAFFSSPDDVEDPVSVEHLISQPVSKNEGFKIPLFTPEHSKPLEGRWIEPGTEISIAGETISCGMVYFGDFMDRNLGYEPSLMNPRLDVGEKPEVKSGIYMAHTTVAAYKSLSPGERRSYLQWLARGRTGMTRVSPAFLFLFLNGLERRCFIDAVSDKSIVREFPVIYAELTRVVNLYREKDYFFTDAAEKFLDFISISNLSQQLYTREDIPVLPRMYPAPAYIRIAVGMAIMDKANISSKLALAWIQSDMSFYTKTAAQRCKDLFEEMFLYEFNKLHPDGMPIKKRGSNLQFSYRPHSNSFPKAIKWDFNGLPDIASSNPRQEYLQNIIETATEQIDSYSRYLGRNPEGANSMEALIYLPRRIWGSRIDALIREIRAQSDGVLTLTLEELSQKFSMIFGTWNKEKIGTLISGLSEHHIGFEPNVNQGAYVPKGKDTVAVFWSDEAARESASSEDLTQWDAALAFAGSLINIGNNVNIKTLKFLLDEIEKMDRFGGFEKAGLKAKAKIYAQAPLSIAAVKKLTTEMKPDERAWVMNFLVRCVKADGSTAPAEVKVLEKIAKALDIDTVALYSSLHSSASSFAPAGLSQMPQSPGGNATGEAKPFTLDLNRINQLQKDSEQVRAVLTEIFEEQTTIPEPVIAPPANDLKTQIAQNILLPGLDAKHEEFLSMILTQDEWSRGALKGKADALGLMLDGALEKINEAGFDAHDMPVTEGDDPIEVNPDILEILKK